MACRMGSRVTPTEAEQELARYVNANYIEGSSKTKERDYIAAQGPNEPTVPAFIQMIWDMKLACVIMCTDLHELGRPKCAKYWGDPGHPLLVNGNEVTGMLCRPPNNESRPYEVRMIKIKKQDGAEHTFAHYWFKSWPDHGVPMDDNGGVSPDEAIKMMKDVRNYRGQRDSKASPLLIHCSAGCGRTGTMICIDKLITATRLRHPIDVIQMIENMRKDRMCMVQHVDQYSFIFQAAIELASDEVGTNNVITADPKDRRDTGWASYPTDANMAPNQPSLFVLKENTPRLTATIGPRSGGMENGLNRGQVSTPKKDLWFKPQWDKEQAKAFLIEQPIGIFVVRASTRVQGMHVISVQEREHPTSASNIAHIMLLQTQKGDGSNVFQLGELGNLTFSTIAALVTHFSRNPYDEVEASGTELYLVFPT